MYFNNDYMQNLNYYNQNPLGMMNNLNQYNHLNPYNIYNDNQTNGLFNNSLNQMNRIQMINNLYPDIYKITNPIVKNMVSGMNLYIIDDNTIISYIRYSFKPFISNFFR